MRYGQVFLRDQNILNKILASLSFERVPELLEIGCGDGVLTEVLLQRCDHVHVIEIDEDCIAATKQRLGVLSERVTFYHQDVLKSHLASFVSQPVAIVANVPYYLSAKLIKWLVQERALLSEAVLMFQLEVVDKFCAMAGQDLYTSLTVFTQFYFEVTKLFKVSNQSFRPVPNVSSAMMRLKVKMPLPEVEEAVFFVIVRSCFWARRKTLKRALLGSPYMKLDAEFLEQDGFLFYANKRAEVLSLDDFLQLYVLVKPFIVEISSDLF